jgi:hypothetical protein
MALRKLGFVINLAEKFLSQEVLSNAFFHNKFQQNLRNYWDTSWSHFIILCKLGFAMDKHS